MEPDQKIGFPEKHAEVLSDFADKAIAELSRDIRPLVVEEVLTKLTGMVTRDIKCIVGFHDAKLNVPLEGPTKENPAELRIPINPFYEDLHALGLSLDNHYRIGGDRSGLTPLTSYAWSPKYLMRLSSYLHKRYGEDAQVFSNMLTAWWFRDETNRDNVPFSVEEVPDFDAARHKDIANASMHERFVKSGKYTKQDILELDSICDVKLAMRLLQGKDATFDRAIDIFEHLLTRRESVREKTMILLQNFRNKQYTALAAAIARQGYRTFLEMEEMTDWDSWALQKERVEKRAVENLQNEDVSKITENFQSEDDADAWVGATNYFHKHPYPPQRRKLKDVIRCDEFRTEMDTLRRMKEWESLGAKERELSARVFSEVIRFRYGRDFISGQNSEEASYVIGTPAFAVENRGLNCFTGPWLMASLLLEAGMPYSNIYYCNANGEQTSASHGLLLVRYDDGSASFIDYGHRYYGKPFLISSIQGIDDMLHAFEFFSQATNFENAEKKSLHEPVKIEISPDVAKAFRLHEHMHVLPLDQGFAATSLLHTGIAFQEEGKLEEALQAYEMGLVIFPSSPDLLTRCAMIEIEKNNDERAQRLIELALAEYNGHLHALYQAGILAHRAGDTEKACEYFSKIVEDKREEWGDTKYKEKANEYLGEWELGLIEKRHKEIMEEGSEGGLTPMDTHLL